MQQSVYDIICNIGEGFKSKAVKVHPLIGIDKIKHIWFFCGIQVNDICNLDFKFLDEEQSKFETT